MFFRRWVWIRSRFASLPLGMQISDRLLVLEKAYELKALILNSTN